MTSRTNRRCEPQDGAHDLLESLSPHGPTALSSSSLQPHLNAVAAARSQNRHPHIRGPCEWRRRRLDQRAQSTNHRQALSSGASPLLPLLLSAKGRLDWSVWEEEQEDEAALVGQSKSEMSHLAAPAGARPLPGEAPATGVAGMEPSLRWASACLSTRQTDPEDMERRGGNAARRAPSTTSTPTPASQGRLQEDMPSRVPVQRCRDNLPCLLCPLNSLRSAVPARPAEKRYPPCTISALVAANAMATSQPPRLMISSSDIDTPMYVDFRSAFRLGAGFQAWPACRLGGRDVKMRSPGHSSLGSLQCV
ncbi:uncharacterized protein AKAME5_000173900 [Lates japonicus]|uniref:Uncharacterized protein n=1 Tax=Lates japonicus TaxID=270547 RepID=A0AAD3M4V8_LATJO|nr:uncharacterized protein AKAME5_000173900 [Lates japonicus]